MPSASEVTPKTVVVHPTTGQDVTVDKVRAVKGGRVRVFFKGFGIKGSITLAPDTPLQIAPERRQRDNARTGGDRGQGAS